MRLHGCDRWRRVYGEAGGHVWWTGEWERECGGCVGVVRPSGDRATEYTWEIYCDGVRDGGFASTAHEAKREADAALRFFVVAMGRRE